MPYCIVAHVVSSSREQYIMENMKNAMFCLIEDDSNYCVFRIESSLD